jgi:hypothetical protein
MPCAVGPPVESNLLQWLIAGDPHRSPVVQTNAFFRA